MGGLVQGCSKLVQGCNKLVSSAKKFTRLYMVVTSLLQACNNLTSLYKLDFSVWIAFKLANYLKACDCHLYDCMLALFKNGTPDIVCFELMVTYPMTFPSC